MTVDFTLLLLGAVALWFPRQWLRRAVALVRHRRVSSESKRILDPWKDREPGDTRIDARIEFLKFRNYFDLVRGATGSLLLFGGMGIAAALLAGAGAPTAVRWQVFAFRSAVVIVGLLIQVVRIERHRVSFYPPVFYLAGLSVGLCGYQAAALAFALIWAIGGALGSAQAFLAVYALILMLLGALFTRFASVSVILAGILALLPVLLSLMSNRPLMVFTRKGSRSR